MDLLLLKNQLQVAPNEPRLANLVVQALACLPGVGGVSFCLEGKMLASAGRRLAMAESCPNAASLGRGCPPSCQWELLPSTRRFPFQASQHCYGGLLLQVDNPTLFEGHEEVLLDLSCYIAQILETRRDAEQRQRDSEEKSRKLFYKSPIGSVWVSLGYRFLLCNEAFCRFLGYQESELIGKTFLEISHPDDRHIGLLEIKALLDGHLELASVEKRYLRKDGNVVWGETTIHLARDESGIPTHFDPVIQDITERKESEAREAAILESMPVILYRTLIPSPLAATWMSATVQRITGFPPAPFLTDPGFWSARIHPEDLPQVVAVFETALYQKEAEVEYRWKCADGRYRWFLDRVVDITPLPDGRAEASGIWLDITERRDALEALRMSEERYRVAALMTGQIVYDREHPGKRVRWAGAIEEITGYDPVKFAQFDVDAFSRLIHPEDHSRVFSALEKTISSASPFQIEYRLRRWDGIYIWVDDHGSFPLNAEGKVDRIVGALKDITGRKREEEHRLRMERQMQQVQKLESLGVLAGGIAHDFNNLLMAILGNAELALEDLPSLSPARESLQEIGKASQRAAELCRQMLAYAGKGQYHVDAILLDHLVLDLFELLKVSISKKTRLNLKLGNDLPPLRGDATQIRQVVMNLVINASESLGEQNGIVTISSGVSHCRRDSLAEAYIADDLEDGLFVWLEVSDTGCGMDPATQRRIFEPFFTTKFTGRGLGLSAVLGIVRSHHGALWVESESGKGSRFRVLLPAIAEQEIHQRPEEVEKSAWQGSGTILLVDDEDAVRETTAKTLERMGFQVLVASNGAEAVRVYQGHGKEIVLVLLDLTMPHLNGEETFAELKKFDPQIRVVMASGYSETDVASRIAGKGLAGVLQKPFNKVELQRVLRTVLGP